MMEPDSKGLQNVSNWGITSPSHITQSLNVRQEVGQRMQETMNTWFKLKPFWEAANCTTPRQQWPHFRHKLSWDNLSDKRTEYENTNRKKKQSSADYRACLLNAVAMGAHGHLSAHGRQKTSTALWI